MINDCTILGKRCEVVCGPNSKTIYGIVVGLAGFMDGDYYLLIKKDNGDIKAVDIDYITIVED